mgnify:CR=1 FL=1
MNAPLAHPPQTDAVPSVEGATPFMAQYLTAKAGQPDAILFFRLGDFYEMFFDDAIRASELLQITLTARAKNAEKVPMAGVPYHSARRYIAKLVEHGLKVAICEQVEEAGSAPGIVRREVTRIITPGMVLDEDSLEPRANNFLAAVYPGAEGYGAALLEASTGEFFTLEAGTKEELVEALARVEPRELLVPEGHRESADTTFVTARLGKPPAVAELEKAAFEPTRAAVFLRGHFAVQSLEAFGLQDAPLATGAAGAALRYLLPDMAYSLSEHPLMLAAVVMVSAAMGAFALHRHWLRRLMAFNVLGSGVFLLLAGMAGPLPNAQALIGVGLLIAWLGTLLGVLLIRHLLQLEGVSALVDEPSAPQATREASQ